MEGVVDYNAGILWESVAVGSEKHRRRTRAPTRNGSRSAAQPGETSSHDPGKVPSTKSKVLRDSDIEGILPRSRSRSLEFASRHGAPCASLKAIGASKLSDVGEHR